ncbi:General transcription factor IIE subunit 1 isoform 3 [Hibiscus syriacus]|uniref:General transcription factor IIE subunit 1 isoform 3 n=1 Tax=Hibiscus syriacus TaxID=106335 RepID=A0A6A3APU3_HIBSY|nr:General transcription factor IIE subunit 1 isoform 3 [Hibiscus syriacus]
MEQLNWVKDMPIPEFGTLQAWEARAGAAGRGLLILIFWKFKFAQNLNRVEVAFSGLDSKEDIKTESASTSLKFLPPWMIKRGTNLTKEQRGEVKQEESKIDGCSAQPDFKMTKSRSLKIMIRIIYRSFTFTRIDILFLSILYWKDECLKAYYAVLYKKQQELEEMAKKQGELSDIPLETGLSDSSERQVGMKAKREDDDEGDDDINWEEDLIAGPENSGQTAFCWVGGSRLTPQVLVEAFGYFVDQTVPPPVSCVTEHENYATMKVHSQNSLLLLSASNVIRRSNPESFLPLKGIRQGDPFIILFVHPLSSFKGRNWWEREGTSALSIALPDEILLLLISTPRSNTISFAETSFINCCAKLDYHLSVSSSLGIRMRECAITQGWWRNTTTIFSEAMTNGGNDSLQIELGCLVSWIKNTEYPGYWCFASPYGKYG